ncbi:Phenylalanine--tRNA ligase beta subunit [BD1-7 clade bacterium]|uniref:Phenylalanine--tRNA ligase beta subunit n=1 Tax=BD1-7 clade bacterium TaxID=2029982 RepID=A0A5S9Q1J1_9GAMM|nr:Phenylalanine--tRNA ligase beta subunit [BD1-7 clade bacterium]CAA0112421.1 Phenylalanine--tRNA ligase beta subunit [BD1-7 clade bacterium]
MKFSEQWLREWVNPSLTTDELVAQITMAGLEVDAVERAAGEFSGVVVAEIVAIEPHPDADKLRVCQVVCGEDEPVQVVCGAVNAALGLKAPFAKVGAILPGDFKIKKAKLRGMPSFGMLCGASELGMEDEIDGLMELLPDAPVGEDVREYLGLNDALIDVDLTPNRGDCLSILGLSRDVGVLNSVDLTPPAMDSVPAQNDAIFPVEINALEDCPRYVGRVIKGVDISATTPLWMVEKLRRSGIRSIDPVVDVTNYVLLELGQPMHAFDLSALNEKIVVRKAKEQETLTLLDGQEIKLKPDALVIADADKALALAGIMGGEGSGVASSTQDILLESAFFAPEKIAGRARSYGLHTDSSHRFERGVDATQQVRAIERATALLIDIAGGEPGPVNEVTDGTADTLRNVSLKRARLDQVLGLAIDGEQIVDILTRLGLDVAVSAEGWDCVVPSYRFDISIAADLIEEIARIYGYNNLPTRKLTVPVDFKPRQEKRASVMRVKHELMAQGYQEAITYSFVDPKIQQLFDDEVPVPVANPISADMAVMRTSLIPGLVTAMQHNLNRQQPRVRLFETGLQFHQEGDEVVQQQYIAGLIYGPRQVESWANDTGVVDFFDIKGDVEGMLAAARKFDVRFERTTRKALHPGQSAVLMAGEKTLGVIGALHPEVTKKLGVSGSVYVFELSLTELLEGSVPAFKPLSKFPQVRRDIAVVVDNTAEANSIVDIVRQNAGDCLQDCLIFDEYAGKGIEDGKKSLAIGMIFQHTERSLNEDDIQGPVDAVVAALEKELQASLRN